ncbi:MAG: hypothetical protein MJY71_08665, partial [Bacteroidaceae bacterium]|nr:hypothetical protein [Bacteroidaceae bacterium]
MKEKQPILQKVFNKEYNIYIILSLIFCFYFTICQINRIKLKKSSKKKAYAAKTQFSKSLIFYSHHSLAEAERSQMAGDLHTIATFRGRPFSNSRGFAHHRHSHKPNVLKWPGICTRSKLNTAAGAFTV